MKAIETHYKGYRFRSRLEARWAVFFDALGIKWEYEKEEHELHNGIRFFPNFVLNPHTNYKHYVEIKDNDEFSDFISRKVENEQRYNLFMLRAATEKPVTVVFGIPDPDIFRSVHIDFYAGNFSIYIGNVGLSPFDNGDPHLFFVAEKVPDLPQKRLKQMKQAGYSKKEAIKIWKFGHEKMKNDILKTSVMQKAYAAARSARFEFGESG